MIFMMIACRLLIDYKYFVNLSSPFYTYGSKHLSSSTQIRKETFGEELICPTSPSLGNGRAGVLTEVHYADNQVHELKFTTLASIPGVLSFGFSLNLRKVKWNPQDRNQFPNWLYWNYHFVLCCAGHVILQHCGDCTQQGYLVNWRKCALLSW